MPAEVVFSSLHLALWWWKTPSQLPRRRIFPRIGRLGIIVSTAHATRPPSLFLYVFCLITSRPPIHRIPSRFLQSIVPFSPIISPADSISTYPSGCLLFAIMPGRVLPKLTPAEVESHDNAQSCYVTLGSKVYDITSFVDDHPGGGDLILEYAGKDV